MDPSHLPLIELDPKDGYNVYHFYIRNKDMTKYIFVDLDETLIHTFNSWEDREGDKVEQFTLSDGDEYTTCLRPGALEFLAKLREIGPVFMLTAAINEYANTVNKLFNFGFESEDIYAREQLNRNEISLPPADMVFLIDNLDKRDNYTKLQFLRFVSKTKVTNYIQCQTFNGGSFFPLDEEQIENIISRIR